MKTATIRMLGKGLTALCLMLWSYAGFSQAGTAVFFEVKNMVQTSPSEFQYEVWCTNTGTTALSIRGYSWGLNTAIGLNQSSYLTQNFVSRDPILSTIPAVNPTPSASVTASPAFPSATSATHFRGTTTNAASGSEVALTAGIPVRLATMRINRVTAANGTVANPWTGNNINPFTNLSSGSTAIQVVTGAGRTQCVATMIVTPPGTSYAVNGTANTAAAGTLQALTAAMTPSPTGPNPFLLNAVTGCTTPVTVTPNDVADVCAASYTWARNGVNYNASGTYTYTKVTGGGVCDSIFTLNLTLTSPVNTSTTVSNCGPYTWTAGSGLTYNTSGTYTFTTQNGPCVNTATLNLTVTNPVNTTDNVTNCGPYTWNGQTYASSGTYTFTSQNGPCVNTATLNLTVVNPVNTTDNVTNCGPYTWAANGQTYATSGTYTYTTQNGPCVNTATLNLTVVNPVNTTDNVTNCGPYTWNGQTYASSGTYTFTSQNGPCVNTATLNLTVVNPVNTTDNVTNCGPYTWNGQTYASSGTYTFTTQNGPCVNTATLNLTVVNPVNTTDNVSNCGPYTWNGQTYATSGTYTFTTQNGPCVNTATLNLTVVNPVNTTDNVTNCGPYTWNGQTYATSGTYTFTTQNGPCVNTATLNLTVVNPVNTTTNATNCGPYTWAANGQTYNASGTYTFTTQNGPCVNTATLNLTVVNPVNTTDNVTNCGPYTWNGQTYATSGTYTFTSQNGPCVNTATLNLTVVNPVNSTTNVTNCGPYTWAANGQTYNTSGTYTYTTQNGPCVNTATLNLTVNNPSGSHIVVSACNSYTWASNSTNYTASGTYYNSGSCGSDTLDLTIVTPVNTSSTVTNCGPYTWNGQTYATSGTYTFTTQNGPCVNTDILNLTVVNPVNHTDNVTNCGAYTWPQNGQSYNASGTYTYTVQNGPCVDNYTLNLTVVNPVNTTSTVSNCGPYTWNGQTYNASGTYTHTTQNGPCVNTDILNLTVVNPVNSTTTATNCGPYTWAANGQTYASSGTYTYTTQNGPCVNTDILNLTVVNPVNTTTNATNCGPYTWAANGQTYASSGTYTYTTQNGPCVNTATLNLTVNPVNNSNTTASAVGSYTWAANGLTYFTSGTYTYTSLNVFGCVETATLNLTITGVLCPFTVTLTENQPISCHGNNDGALDVVVTPAGSYSYSIDGGAFGPFTTVNGYFNNLTPGVHVVAVTDGTCTTTASLNFVEPDPLDMTFYTDSMVSCLGNDGTVSLCISGGTANLQPYLTWWYAGPTTINWPAPGFTLNDLLTDNFAVTLNNLGAGVYTVKTEDDRGCFYEETYTILQAAPVTVTAQFNPILCNGGTTAVTPVGSGGVMYMPSNSTTSAPCPAPIAATVSTLTYAINGMPIAASYGPGTYTLTATDAKGCSASTVFTLSNPAVITGSSSATACDTYSWNGNTYTTSGAYSATFTAANGCDSVHTLNLTINYSTSTTSNVTACDSYTWAQNGTTYTVSGTYTAVGVNNNGCPETHTLNLTINYSTSSSSTEVACDSYTWSCNGMTYTQSGTYTCTYMNAAGCTHTATLNLTINNSSSSSSTVSACDSYTWSCNGATYTQSGTYTCTYLNASGCVHTATLNLTIKNSSPTTHVYYTWCDQYTWALTGQTYTASGNYTASYTNAAGCDSNTVLHLTLGYTQVNVLCCVTSCGPYSWTTANGTVQTVTQSGTYYTIGQQGVNGCAIVNVLCITIGAPTFSSESATACGSYTWPANGMTYTASGTYTQTSLNAAGCVHTTTLNLTINTGTYTTSTVTACDSYNWTTSGMTYTASGTYTHTSMNAAGCINTSVLNLTINNSSNSVGSATACDSYTWACNGATYTQSGLYTCTYLNAGGCVHTAVLNLTVNYSTSGTTTANACDSYTWACNGATYTQSGMYTCTYLNASGCVHTQTLDLTVNYSSSSSSSATACDSYTWTCNGATYTSSGIYTCTYINANGCLHTATLNLTINNSSNSNSTVTACDSYTWGCNGATYTQSGTYTCTYINNSGCLHTATLNLTVNYSSSSSSTVFACDSYTWNGTTYTTSGVYTYTSLNASGCVNTATLDLTVHYNSTSSTSVTACDTYTWNGTTYTTSGTYTYTSINGTSTPSYCAAGSTTQGCVSGDEFIENVTFGSINNNSSCVAGGYQDFTAQSTNVMPGSTYTISVANGNDFSGDQLKVWADWNQNGTFEAGETTTLTYVYGGTTGATNVTTGSITVPANAASGPTRLRIRVSWTGTNAACGSVQYGEVEDYTVNVLGPNTTGCVNTATLNLTINNSTTSTESATACNSYTWACNGQTYTASGTYTCTSLNAAGCVNTATLTLTINNSTTSTESQFACDSYTWNGTTYTTSGTYTYTSLNAAGCVHTATLVLVVNYSTFNGNATVTACDSYTWNGSTYTASGVYTYTSYNTPSIPAYCTAGATTQGCNTGDEFIENVTFGSINNTSTCQAGGYANYTAQSTNVTAGNSYAISVANGNDWSGDQLKVWVDWNQNGTFEAGETTVLPYVYSGSQGSTNITNGTIAVPSTALNGPTRMRIRVSYTGTNAACGSVTYGEVEDYTVNVSGGATLPPPCLNTATLTLTINNSTSGTTTATACNSYTWSCNGATYTQSGSYTCTYLNAAGCVHTETLNLTVNYSTSGTTTITSCDAYTWACNGATYTTSGSYTCTYLNTAGCVHTQTLNLTINYSTSGTTTAVACDSYTWACNGATYTTSGSYTCTYLNQFGCLHTQTLNLTVNYSTTNGGTTTTQCNSYLWNGTTYTASGVYTYTTMNTAGCVNTATLNLTINYGSSSTTNIAACNSYTWTNGITYTASGTYTYTINNSAGCDSALTLNLTMTNGVRIAAKALLQGAFDASTGLMKDSLRRVTHFENVNPTTTNYPCTYGVAQVGPAVNVIPQTRPNFAQFYSSCDGDTVIGASVYATMSNAAYSDNNSIVDWAFIEVRDGSNYNNVVGGKYGLLQRDGDIVSATDGVSPLYFPCVCPGNYYIVVKHRNHLGVMTNNTVALSSAIAPVDFTDPNPATVWVKPGAITNAPRYITSGKGLLWGGDANTNKNSKYNGLANDKEQILADIASILCSPLVPPGSNNIFYQTYKNSDLNMDGKVKYNNADNDKNWLLNTILISTAGSTPNTIISQHTP